MTDRDALAREALAATQELERALAENPGDIDRCCLIATRIGKLRQRELTRLVRSIAEIQANLTEEQRKLLEDTRF